MPWSIARVGIDFDPIAAPPCLFGCDQARTTASEGVENDSPALGAIQNGVGNQRQGFGRRVHGKFGTAVLAKGVHPWVIPDICTITTKTPQFDIIDMWRGAFLENKDQL